MNAGDLISLLLVLLFVASAFFGRGTNRTGTGRERPPRRPDTVDEERAPDRPAHEAPPRQDDRPGAGPARAEGEGGGPAEDLRKRLEEARRRVREAAAGEGEVLERRPSAERGGRLAGGGGERSTTSGPGGTPPAGAPARPAPGRSTSGPPQPPAGSEPPPRRAPEARDARKASSTWREARREPWAARTRARRKPVTRSARLSAAELLGEGRRSVVRGYVWSVILSDPVYPSTRRRKVSRRRSP